MRIQILELLANGSGLQEMNGVTLTGILVSQMVVKVNHILRCGWDPMVDGMIRKVIIQIIQEEEQFI